MLYRALDNLSNGIRRWQIFDESRLKESTRRLLEQRGVIASVNAPPLMCVEGWSERADALAASGIETLADVVLFPGLPTGVEADAWALWRAEAEAALTIKCIGCSRRR